MRTLQNTLKSLSVAAMAFMLSGCQPDSQQTQSPAAQTSRPAVSEAVAKANQAVRDELDFSNRTDFDLAERGYLGSLEDTLIMNEDGDPAYDFGAFGFLDGEAPDSVNPSLWRQSQLNAKHGLFEVVDGIYQVRGYDLSNITFIRGETGWIVVDPLITKETAAAAKRLVDEKLGAFPISALVLTHSHIDHYGGIRGLISEADVKKRC